MQPVNEVAKNLLENKTCDACIHQCDFGCSRDFGSKNNGRVYYSLPKERTCERWKKRYYGVEEEMIKMAAASIKKGIDNIVMKSVLNASK